MTFFERIFPMLDGVDVTINMKRKGDTITIGITPNALKDIQPAIVTGTAEELDEKFFETVAFVSGSSKEAIANIEDFKKSVDEAVEDEKSDSGKGKKTAKKPTPAKEKPKANATPKEEKKPEPAPTVVQAGLGL